MTSPHLTTPPHRIPAHFTPPSSTPHLETHIRPSKMSGPVTEYSYFATKPGLDVFNPDTSEGQALLNAVDTALSQPGATRVYYGAEVENPENVWLFLDWESLEDHMNYRNSE